MTLFYVLIIACFYYHRTNAENLVYDDTFDPTAHQEPDKTEYHIDLNSLIDDALTSTTQLYTLYSHYKAKHGIEHEYHETSERRKLFREYLVRVQRLRQDPSISWTAGITPMGHLTDCEKSLKKMGNKTDHMDAWEECQEDDNEVELEEDSNGLQASGGAPARFDWRAYGAVTRVKDQDETRNCWAFAAVTVMEAWLMRLTGAIDELSTQELADCVYYGHTGHSKGGGWPHHAWEYVKNEGRLGYRYQIPERLEGNSGSCSFKWAKNALDDFGVEVYKTKYFKGLGFGGDDYMEMLALISPIAVIIKADEDLMDAYVGGAYDPRTSTQCAGGDQHAVAIVGYDSTYFYIKNSWGVYWGNDGYIWWVRAPGKEDCGIYSHGSILLMNKITTKKTKKQLEVE